MGVCQRYAGNFEGCLYEEQGASVVPIPDQYMVDEARRDFIRIHGGTRHRFTIFDRKPRWLTAASVLVAALLELACEDEGGSLRRNCWLGSNFFSSADGTRFVPRQEIRHIVSPLRRAGLPDETAMARRQRDRMTDYSELCRFLDVISGLRMSAVGGRGKS